MSLPMDRALLNPSSPHPAKCHSSQFMDGHGGRGWTLTGGRDCRFLLGKLQVGEDPWPRTCANSKVPKEGRRPGQGREEERVP